MHVTVLYSEEGFDASPLGGEDPDGISVSGGSRSLEVFGEAGDCLVIAFDSEELRARHAEAIQAGASHGYPDYRPHVTVAKCPEGHSLDGVEPFPGDLNFGPEIFEELDPDWGEDADGEVVESVQEALDSVPVRGFFVVEDGKARFLDSLPESAEPVAVSSRNWAQIVANEESKTNRARIITTVSRSRAIRRMKQEARRLRSQALVVVGGELQYKSGETDIYGVVGAFRWKPNPGDIKESSGHRCISAEAAETIKAMQDSIASDGVPDIETLRAFMEVSIFFDEGLSSPDESDAAKRSRSSQQMATEATESVRVEIEKARVLPRIQRAERMEEIWFEHGLLYEASPRRSTLEAVSVLGFEEGVKSRVLESWPGPRTFDRLLSEDRVLVRVPGIGMVSASTGCAAVPETGTLSESLVSTSSRLDWQELCDVKFEGVGSPGDPHAASGGSCGEGGEPEDVRRRNRTKRKRQRQRRLFG